MITNNLVRVDQKGKESVSCTRSDGLAFDVLRQLRVPAYILSTETNAVVSVRAEKLGVRAIQGEKNKAIALKNLVKEMDYDLDKICYTGNDLNDYRAMQISGITVCPADSHPKIKKISQFVLKTKGGEGVVRELIEEIFDIDFLEKLFPG